MCEQSIQFSAHAITPDGRSSQLAGWEWEGPWEAEEWAYAPDWSVMGFPPTPSARERSLVDFVRRRRWVRPRRRQQISLGAPEALRLLPAWVHVCLWAASKTQSIPCSMGSL